MLQNVVAIERDGLDFRAVTILCEVPDTNFNLEYAVRKAVTDYVSTEEGRKLYEYNCSSMNWGDFAVAVPNDFCRKYGFEKITSAASDIIVDYDEHLVNDSELDDEEERDNE